jgi:hypothetical protein
MNFDNIEIGDKPSPKIVKTLLDDLNLKSKVNPVLRGLPIYKQVDILQIPIRETKDAHKAGYWHPSKRIIYLHYLLRSADLPKAFLHELGHCIHDTIHGYYNDLPHHGPEWKRIMIQMGEEPKRLHNLSYLGMGKDFPFRYICSDCGYEWKRQHHSSKLLKSMHRRCRHKPNHGRIITPDGYNK